ncbi:MAG: fasciclin domain-containing protein [Bacteroidales bacterium]|nr:fasciclin domain-containing protein [Bacteroidales bacterium]MCF8389885.1 fasciclin domain-containing protein [Bacteroidales bacterium]
MKKLLILIAGVAIFLGACEKEKTRYYERPEWLKGPLFDQIKSTGEFKEFVKAAEYVDYDTYLNSRLTFTVFVPTDEAFTEYYTEKSINSIDQLDKDEVLALLQYHTMQFMWDSSKIVNKTSFNWWVEMTQNFRTPSVYIPPISEERSKNIAYDNTFLLLFSTPFFTKYGLDASDYETIFPGSTYTGYNIDRAGIIQDENSSENGFYYIVDKVLNPRTTADKVIEENPDFSIFSDLASTFVRYNYDASRSLSNTEYDSLFKKNYALNFNMSFEKTPDNAPDGYYHVFGTAFVPVNAAIEKYFSDNFSAYGGIDDVPNIIKKYFVEAHLIANKKLFPTTLAGAEDETNDFSDPILFDMSNGITSVDISSNALIYGVDEPINSNAFSTVSGPIIKNPSYTIFTLMLELSGEFRSFFKPEINHVAIVLNDDKLTSMGFVVDPGDPIDFTDDKIYRNNGKLSNDNIIEFLKSFISITGKEVDGIKESFIKTKNGSYLRIGDGTIKGVFGESPILNTSSSINGVVFETDTDLTILKDSTIEDYLNALKGNYTEFFALCDSAGLLDGNKNLKTLPNIAGITMLVPTDDAVNAIKGSYIPIDANKTTFDYNKLVLYQLIYEKVIFTDDTIIPTEYGTGFKEDGIRLKITVEAGSDMITITDKLNNKIDIISDSNTNMIFSNGAIHVVDKLALF